jgi:hypothetical protein
MCRNFTTQSEILGIAVLTEIIKLDLVEPCKILELNLGIPK